MVMENSLHYEDEIFQHCNAHSLLDEQDSIVRFIYNENNFGFSSLVLQELLKNIEHSNLYAVDTLLKLLRHLHYLHDLSFDIPNSIYDENNYFEAKKNSKILLGVGSTEILKAVALCYGQDGGEIIEANPSYSMVSLTAKSIWGNKVQLVSVPLLENYCCDWKGIINALTSRTRVVIVTNPNNPTGTALKYHELVSLADNLDSKILLVIDEAYIEFATTSGVKSMSDLTKDRPNILITRTFSKFHGLAGLRLGYGIGSSQVVEKLRNYVAGFAGINRFAAVAALTSLNDQQHQAKTIDITRKMKRKLKMELLNYGFQPVPSETNFIWANLNQDCQKLIHYLRTQRIYVASGYRWSQPEHIRISIGKPEEIDMFASALAAFN